VIRRLSRTATGIAVGRACHAIFQLKEFRMPIIEEVRTVTADGRLVVPWAIQHALGLDHGGPVRFHVENGVVTLVAVEAKPAAAPRHEVDVQRTHAELRAQLIAELKTLMEAADRDRTLAEAAD
jgi:bifunctional DNA-binding transcriptional regulator/antitoxin component of YhaV-PrlF toxin-antitoxin module